MPPSLCLEGESTGDLPKSFPAWLENEAVVSEEFSREGSIASSVSPGPGSVGCTGIFDCSDLCVFACGLPQPTALTLG